MVKIEFPADRADIALAVGKALLSIAGAGNAQVDTPVETDAKPEHNGETDEDTEAACAAPREATAVSEAADERTDHKGAPFFAPMCAAAKEPFYSSGLRAGQWKKRKGVDETAYDQWHASAATAEPAPSSEVLTAAAFGPTAEVPTASHVTPVDLGTLMTWISGKQVAGVLTQQDIDGAYTQLQLTITDLLPPTAPDAVRTNISNVHALLAAKGGD